MHHEHENEWGQRLFIGGLGQAGWRGGEFWLTRGQPFSQRVLQRGIGCPKLPREITLIAQR